MNGFGGNSPVGAERGTDHLGGINLTAAGIKPGMVGPNQRHAAQVAELRADDMDARLSAVGDSIRKSPAETALQTIAELLADTPRSGLMSVAGTIVRALERRQGQTRRASEGARPVEDPIDVELSEAQKARQAARVADLAGRILPWLREQGQPMSTTAIRESFGDWGITTSALSQLHADGLIECEARGNHKAWSARLANVEDKGGQEQ